MTRKEEMEHAWLGWAVQSYYRFDERSFKEGVKWADKTMIDKACKWLQEEVLNAYKGVVWEQIVEDFRKAMKE